MEHYIVMLQRHRQLFMSGGGGLTYLPLISFMVMSRVIMFCYCGFPSLRNHKMRVRVHCLGCDAPSISKCRGDLIHVALCNQVESMMQLERIDALESRALYTLEPSRLKIIIIIIE